MATVTGSGHSPGACPRGGTANRGAALAERGLLFAAAAGAMCGVLAGAAVGAEVGTAFPVACSTLGAALGSGLAAAAWCLFARTLAALLPVRETTPARNDRA